MATNKKHLRTLINKEVRLFLEAIDPKVKAAKIKSAQAKVDAAKAEMQVAQDEFKAAQALKEDEMLLMNLIEAEEDKAEEPSAEGGDNPFAAATGEEGGEEGGGDEASDEESGEKDKETQPAAEKEDLTVTFDVNRVKKYNNQKFRGNTGVVKKITKDGLVVNTQPDNVDILINFDDITESVKKFFKNKK